MLIIAIVIHHQAKFHGKLHGNTAQKQEQVPENWEIVPESGAHRKIRTFGLSLTKGVLYP